MGRSASNFSLNAANVAVAPGGSITTRITPELADIVGRRNQRVDLGIFSGGDVLNSGTISSSGNLVIEAIGKIVNSPSATGLASTSQPTISAAGNVNLLAGSGQFINGGRIESLLGNVNFNTLTGRDLLVNNLGGQIAAANGSITFRDPSYLAKDLTQVLGGKLSAESIDMFGGNGLVKVAADEISGLVNVSGGTANIYASSGELNIGKMELTGDPNIANSGGDVVLSGNLLLGGQNLAILASGNVRAAPGATSINLSNNSNNGGNLNILAGYDFTPDTGGGQVDNDTSTTYTITGPSASGGAVMLSQVNVFTAFTGVSGPGNGGSVTITASDGNSNMGTVSIKSVNTGAVTLDTNHQSGSIAIFGLSGVLVDGDVSSRGDLGGAITISGERRLEPSGGTVTFLNGTRGGTGTLAPSATTPTRATAVIVNGAVDATGLDAAGGEVKLFAETLVKVSGTITSASRGTSNGANITISSLSDNKPMINVTGGLTASCFGANSPSQAGSGGNILLEGGTLSTVGTIDTSGGFNLGSGNAGNGGSITLTTIANNLGTSPVAGNVGSFVITGSIESQGGNAIGGGAGGSGGNIVVNAATFRVLGTGSGPTSGNSIFASGGSGGSATGGSVSITTKGFQPLPTNFNLLSTQATEVALPGGMFNVGNPAVNGTAGNITNGANTLSSSDPLAARVVNTNKTSGTLSITTSISATDIFQPGLSGPIAVDDGNGNRTLVTPGQALALYQITRDTDNILAQTVGLNALGQVTAVNPSTHGAPSVFTTGSREQLLPFTTFVVASAPPGLFEVRVEFQGLAPIVDLSSVVAPQISGTLVFPTANAQPIIDLGSKALTVPAFATIQANNGGSSSLLIVGGGKTWSISGSMLVDELRIEHAVGTAFGLNVAAPTGTLQTNFASGNGVIMHVPAQALTLNLRDSNNLIDTVDGYEELKVPVAFLNLFLTSQSNTALVKDPTNIKVTLSNSGPTTVLAGSMTAGGTASISTKIPLLNISLGDASHQFSLSATSAISVKSTAFITFGNSSQIDTGTALKISTKVPGNVEFGANSQVNAGTTFLIKGAQEVRADDNVAIEAGKVTVSAVSIRFDPGSSVETVSGISMKSSGDIILNETDFQVSSGRITLTTPTSINTSLTTMQAGVLDGGAPSTGVLAPSNIVSSGSIVLTAGAISAMIASQFKTAGGDIRFTGKDPTATNAVAYGDGCEFRADGGNIFLFSVTDIQGGGPSLFIARAVGENDVGKGGGVELGAGITNSGNLAAALKGASVSNVPPETLGSFVTINNTNGVVRKIGPGIVDLTTIDPTVLNVNRGALVFDALNGHKIQAAGDIFSEFNVAGFVPIKYEADEDCNCENWPLEHFISFVVPAGASGVQCSEHLECGADTTSFAGQILKSDGGLRLSGTRDGAWRVNSGSALIRATGTLRLLASASHVIVKKGALVSLDATSGQLRVRVLSGPGHVAVVAAGKTMPLGPGREAYLSDHIPADDEAHCRDDVGRRELRKYPLAGGCALTICDFSIVSLLSSEHHLKHLAGSQSRDLRQIFDQLVKTAAAVEQLTSARGPYVAKPVAGAQRDHYQAVSYQP